MNEHTEDPVGHASSKIVQYVSLATMAAEAIAQVRQQRIALAAAADERTAAALRAQRKASLAAARVQWGPVLDSRLRARTGVVDAGLAWAVAQSWREVDPEAEAASDRATERLRELRPDVMERYDRLTADGLEPVEAMRRVAPFMDHPAARPGEHTARPPLEGQSSASRQHFIDTGRYLDTDGADTSRAGAADTAASLDDRRGATTRPEPHLTEATVHDRLAEELQSATKVAGSPSPGVTLTMARTAPQVAKDGYPEPLTGEVLAAGRVKPKTPEKTGPAAVRANSLATAARASGRAR
jgi:hypothetical protein